MKIVVLVSRLLLGLVFVVFGLNGFLHFIPQGPMPTGHAGEFFGVIMATHYYVPIFAVQLACGLLFLFGCYTPLSLTLIAPVIVNILLFHILMMPSTIAPAIVVTILWFIVASSERAAFAGILRK